MFSIIETALGSLLLRKWPYSPSIIMLCSWQKSITLLISSACFDAATVMA